MQVARNRREEKELVQVKSSSWRQISKSRQRHSAWSFFLEKLFPETEWRRGTEELDFETEVAQAAASSAILLNKKPRQERGPNELRDNNWWAQGYRNWDGAAFQKRLRVSRDTFEFILAEIKNDIVKHTYSNETPSHTSWHSFGNVPVSTYS